MLDRGLIGVFVKIVTDVKPRFFIIENVPQLASAKSPYRRLFLAMMRRLSNEGYGVSSEVVDASKYGVPQKRKRLMVLGRLDGSAPSIQGPSSAPATTSGEALDGLPDLSEAEEALSGKWAELIQFVPPGDNYLHFTERRGCENPLFEWRSRYWNFLLKLNPFEPSPTIQARPGPSTGPFHWENRKLESPGVETPIWFPRSFCS